MWTLLKIKLIRQQLNRENVIWFNRSVKTNRHFKKRVTSKVNNFKIAGSDHWNVPSWGQQKKVSPTAKDSPGYRFHCHLTCSCVALHPPFASLPTVRHKTEETCTGQCLTWPSVYWLLQLFFFFLIVTGTQNVMCGKILLGVSIWIQCKVPALLTSIQPDKRRCSQNSLSDICWEYIRVKVELVICLQIDTFYSRCKWC